MPPGLMFGPSSAPPPKFKRTKTVAKRKTWCSQSEQKRKVWTKAGSERQRKAKLPEKKREREEGEGEKERLSVLRRLSLCLLLK